MYIEEMIRDVSDLILFTACLFILVGCLYITIKSRFIQVRFIPNLVKMIKGSFKLQGEKNHHTISPFRALLTAMSTTLGISTIVAPVIAINLGGPGALLG